MALSTDKFQNIPDKLLFRPDEVAKIFRVHIRTVYNWHIEGKLEGIKITPSCLRFSYLAVIKLLNSTTKT